MLYFFFFLPVTVGLLDCFSRCNVRPFSISNGMVSGEWVLTLGIEWHLGQQVDPVLVHLDGLLLLLLLLHARSLLVRMREQLLDILWVESVEYVEEVGPVCGLLLQVFVGQVCGQGLVVLHHLRHLLDGQLLQPGHDDVVDLGDPEDLLLVLEELLEEVMVDVLLLGKIELQLQKRD